jgi:hypothetical protein
MIEGFLKKQIENNSNFFFWSFNCYAFILARLRKTHENGFFG